MNTNGRTKTPITSLNLARETVKQLGIKSGVKTGYLLAETGGCQGGFATFSCPTAPTRQTG